MDNNVSQIGCVLGMKLYFKIPLVKLAKRVELAKAATALMNLIYRQHNYNPSSIRIYLSILKLFFTYH